MHLIIEMRVLLQLFAKAYVTISISGTRQTRTRKHLYCAKLYSEIWGKSQDSRRRWAPSNDEIQSYWKDK